MKIFKYLAFSTLIAMSVSGVNSQEFEKGLAAFNAGDVKTAFKEWMPLAESGDVRAQYNIAWAYQNGKGTLQNDVEAVKWFRLAADQGDARAQYNVGWMIENGKGVIQNNVMAHMWYNIASANGDGASAALRDEIAAKMTQEAIEKAQAMAQECMSSGYKNCGD